MTTQTPRFDSLSALQQRDDLSSHLHRQLIGWVAFALPFVLLIIAGWRPTAGLQQRRLLDSISAYYYTGAVAAFVGSLVALAAFLATYRGFDNKPWRDRVAAIVAGGAAVGLAFFPTGAPDGLLPPSWWTTQTRTIHYISAVVLFGALIFFSLFLFPKSNATKGNLPTGKKVRNAIYISCGVVMLACMLWAGSAYFTQASIFWPETIALAFFALSWLTKGRADWTVGRTIHYGRHPGQLINDMSRVILG